MSIRRFACLLIFALSLSVAPYVANAEIIPTLSSPVEILVIPEFPKPDTTVYISAQNLLNKDGLSYTWTVNSQVVAQGVGVSSTNISVGGIGARTTIGLIVRDGSFVITEVTRTILPTELDLVWEANTYTPPLYNGKPLPTADSTVTISAIPNIRVDGVRIPSNALIYEWYLNDSSTPFKTGYGLDTVSVAPPVFGSSFTISTTVKTQGGSAAARQTTTITPQNPRILLYEQSPLLGVLFNSTLASSFRLVSDEVTLKLFPLFIANTSHPSYMWELNGSTIDTEDTPREITLRKTGPGTGKSTLVLSFETPGMLFEEAEKVFDFTF